MNIQVKRTIFNPSCTLGEMSVNGNFFAYTLEDTFRELEPDGSNKVFGSTAIPCGTYNVITDFSTHFGKTMIHILDVPFFEGVRVHGGNTDADTEGCILIGAQTNKVNRIWECADLVAKLTDMVQSLPNGETCTIEVTM